MPAMLSALFICLSVYQTSVCGFNTHHIISAHGIEDYSRDPFKWDFADLTVKFYVPGGMEYANRNALVLHQLIEKGSYRDPILTNAVQKTIKEGSLVREHYAAWGYEFPATSGLFTIIESEPRLLQLAGNFPEYDKPKDAKKNLVKLTDIAKKLQKDGYKGTIHWLACRQAMHTAPEKSWIARIEDVYVPKDKRLPWKVVQSQRLHKWKTLGEKQQLEGEIQIHVDGCSKFKNDYDELYQTIESKFKKAKFGSVFDSDSKWFTTEKKKLFHDLDAILILIRAFGNELTPLSSDKVLKDYYAKARTIYNHASDKLRCKLYFSSNGDRDAFMFVYDLTYDDDFEDDLELDFLDRSETEFIDAKRKEMKKDCWNQGRWKKETFEEESKRLTERSVAKMAINNQLLNGKYMDLVKQIELLYDTKNRDSRRVQRLLNQKQKRKHAAMLINGNP